MIVRHRPGAFPTRSARILTYVHLGLYDAFVAASDSRETYFRPRPSGVDERIDPLLRVRGSSYADPGAAMAGAAEVLLPFFFPGENPERFTNMADNAVRSRLLAGVNYASDLRRARALGHKVAEAVLAKASTDGAGAPWDFQNERVCVPADCDDPDQANWQPTPIIYQYPPTEPMASKWKTFLIESPSQFRAPPPPAYGSETFMTELAEVKDASDNATARQRELAFFWDDGPGTFSPAGHWNELALDIMRNRKTRQARAVRAFALMNAATFDAFVSAWETKYHYWSIRPVTAIRERPTILGQPNPLYDEDWLPNLVTPPFPAYVSGHSTESAAAARVLQYLFPDTDDPPDDIATATGPRGSIDRLAQQVGRSRLFAGIHFRSDNEAGLVMGRQIAGLAIQRAESDGSEL